eukprot:349839-Chlamydomonas_euryale.AAC.3
MDGRLAAAKALPLRLAHAKALPLRLARAKALPLRLARANGVCVCVHRQSTRGQASSTRVVGQAEGRSSAPQAHWLKKLKAGALKREWRIRKVRRITSIKMPPADSLPNCPPACPPACLPACPPIQLPSCLPTCLPVHPCDCAPHVVPHLLRNVLKEELDAQRIEVICDGTGKVLDEVVVLHGLRQTLLVPLQQRNVLAVLVVDDLQRARRLLDGAVVCAAVWTHALALAALVDLLEHALPLHALHARVAETPARSNTQVRMRAGARRNVRVNSRSVSAGLHVC